MDYSDSILDLDLVVSSSLRVVARVLVEEGQRLHRRHAIEEQHAVEVVGLVLGHARREIL